MKKSLQEKIDNRKQEISSIDKKINLLLKINKDHLVRGQQKQYQHNCIRIMTL